MFTRAISAARLALTGSIALLALALSACGGDSSLTGGDDPSLPDSCGSSSCGTAYISLMDADGDFDTYTVDVVSLTLEKANGSTVEALPAKSRVDFADLVDLKEFIAARSVPAGAYVQGRLRLDYTNADIVVDVNGVPTPAVAVDANGAPLTTVDLDIRLDDRKQLVITAGRAALLDLDFDLLASNMVDTSTNPVQVTVQPFVVASIDVADSREARMRGPLVSVDTASGDYHIDLRPFHLRSGRFGEVTIHTTATTEFEINGTPFTGADGIAELATLSAGTPTVAYGTLDVSQRRFTATRVHAGTSVPGSQFDVVEGNVVARSGSNLTVAGATLIRRTGSVVFERRNTTVVIGPGTKVTRDGDAHNTLGIDTISVGQRIHAFGTVTEASNGDATLDATAGRVRMHLTHLLGTVKSSLPGLLTLELDTIDGHRASVFDFTGTGVQPADDATASSYEIDTGLLSLANLETNSPARVFGFVAPFGDAPPDFTARTLVDFRDIPAVLAIGWGLAGTSAPFLSIDATSGLVIDHHNSNIGLRHFIRIGPRLIDVQRLGSAPTVAPDTTRPSIYAIGEPRRVEIFTTFSDFIDTLNAKLLTQKVSSLSVTGRYDEAANVLTAHRVLVQFKAN